MYGCLEQASRAFRLSGHVLPSCPVRLLSHPSPPVRYILACCCFYSRGARRRRLRRLSSYFGVPCWHNVPLFVDIHRGRNAFLSLIIGCLESWKEGENVLKEPAGAERVGVHTHKKKFVPLNPRKIKISNRGIPLQSNHPE